MMRPATTLILGWGNPGRRDDGLGPALVAAVGELGLKGVSLDADYQLAPEDAAEVARHDRVIFVDADRSGPAPFRMGRLRASDHRPSFTTHRVAPAVVLALCRDLFGAEPEAWLMGIRGYAFDEFGEGLSAGARENLERAVDHLRRFVASKDEVELCPTPGT